MEAGYAWLLDIDSVELVSQVAENHSLLADLWAFEAWRMEGERDSEPDDDENDEEYDLPTALGYAVLKVAPDFVITEPPDVREPLWRAILEIGPNGHHAVEHFASSWFLLLFKNPNPDRFMATWKAMLDYAFAANWSSGRRWFHGRRMLMNLLGLYAHSQLSQATEIMARLPDLTAYYRRWAQSGALRDEDDLATFSHFLTTEAGSFLRLEGMCWINEAVTQLDRFYRTRTGNDIVEAVDTILTQNADELLRQVAVRDAVISIVSKLVASQVQTAMGLQARIAALK